MSDTIKVYQFKRKNLEGFTSEELIELLKEFPDINIDKYNDSMLCHTCPIINGELVFYVYDVAAAIACGLENRDLSEEEFD